MSIGDPKHIYDVPALTCNHDAGVIKDLLCVSFDVVAYPVTESESDS